MRQKHSSFAFLMEMLWVCGFFIISACIFVMAFVKADRMSLNARNLNQAVISSQSALEETFYLCDTGTGNEGSRKLYYDSDWQALDNEQQAAFCITIDTATDKGLLKVSVTACNIDGTDIYSLDGTKYLTN